MTDADGAAREERDLARMLESELQAEREAHAVTRLLLSLSEQAANEFRAALDRDRAFLATLEAELAAEREAPVTAELEILRRFERAWRRFSNSLRPDCTPLEWAEFEDEESVQEVDDALGALRAKAPRDT